MAATSAFLALIMEPSGIVLFWCAPARGER